MNSSLPTPLRPALSGPSLPTPEALRETLVEQQQLIARKSEIIAEQQKRIALLEEQIRLLRAKRFGPSSEQSSGQRALFDEDETPAQGPAIAPPETESTRKKRRGGRKGLSAD